MQPVAVNAGAPEAVTRSDAFAARLRDLQARSEAADHAAAAALQELKTAGYQLADAMDRLADAMQQAGQ